MISDLCGNIGKEILKEQRVNIVLMMNIQLLIIDLTKETEIDED